MLLLVTAMLVAPTLMTVDAVVPTSTGPLYGPHFKEIIFKIYATSEAEVAGLVAQDIDLVDFFEAEQLPDIQSGLDDGSLLTTQAAEQGMWVFDLQNQRYPLNITDFRRALAHLVDKDDYVQNALDGLAYPLDTFLGSPGYGPWAGQDAVIYDFDPSQAEALLDNLGFTVIQSGDDAGWRMDPKTGEKLRELVIIARTEHAHRIYAARALATLMDKDTGIGIPYDLREVPRSVASPLVFLENDYDIYTGGWGGGPDVDWMWDLHHSDSPPSMNYILARNDTLDAALDQAKFGATYEEVLEGIQTCQRIISEQVVRIPLYSKAYISPYNSRLVGILDLPWWQGVANWMTFKNASDKDTPYGDVLNVGWTSDPEQPSPMFEINWWWDTMLINEIYEYLIFLDQTTFEEQPALAKDWMVEPWTAPGDIDGLKITFDLCDNATWHDGPPVTAEDVVFTWLYAQAEENPVYISYLLNLVDAEATDTYTAVAYLNTTSYWALHWMGANIPIIPKHIWEDITDSVTYQPLTEGNLIGCGPYRFKEYKPGDYLIIEANPTFYRKPVDSTLGYETVTLTQGDTKDYMTENITYLDTPITNGTYTITVQTTAGALVDTFTGTVDDGIYSATLDTTDIDPGTYLMAVELIVPVGVGLGSLDQYQLVVEAVPPDYTLIIGGIVVVVVVVALGYTVLRKR
jgi:peptide/nickel transport system substrate-binding protein